MAHIIFDKMQIELNEGQSVLSALLERDYAIPNACQAGVCQSCMLQAVEGEVPAGAQVGLKDTQKEQGYFLACCCQPQKPLHVVQAGDESLRSQVKVTGHEFLSGDVLRLRLQPVNNFAYRAGQFITVWKNASLGRSYSLASVAELDDGLELHIRRIANGQLSNWLHDEIKIGDELQIQSATGDCFYVPGNEQQKTLLAGTGTGLAPLIGIARDALQQGHSGEIHLIHGSRNLDDLYMHQTLLEMAKQYSQFHYYANVLELSDTQCSEQENASISTTPLEQQVIELATNPADCKAYLCGDAGMVNRLKKKLFLSGVGMSNIYTDAFVNSANA
jgi:CDP-4-dehydro-6-deoxyglucose reductase, E3